jgi:hypothetical protein
MKLNILTTAALLAIAGTALTQSAKAQFSSTNPNGNGSNEDLILSFSQGTNSANDYELDLGNADKYLDATSTISIANVLSDLNSFDANGFDTDAGLSLNITGVYIGSAADTGAPGYTINNDTLFGAVGSSTSKIAGISPATQGTDAGFADDIYSPGGTTNNPATDGSAAGSFFVPTANVASYQTLKTKDGVGNSVAFSANGSPDLYLDVLTHGSGFTAGASTVDGNGFFTVTSGGEVEYVVPAASPEPSTYALMALGAGLLFWQIRRKSVASL